MACSNSLPLSSLPGPECPEPKPIIYRIQLIDAGKIKIDGKLYELEKTSDDFSHTVFRSLDLREMWVPSSLYGFLIANQYMFGDYVFQFESLNGKLKILGKEKVNNVGEILIEALKSETEHWKAIEQTMIENTEKYGYPLGPMDEDDLK